MSWNGCGQKIRYDTRLVEYHRVYQSWQFIEVQKIKVGNMCYDLKSLEWDSKTTLVLSNTRELDRVPKTKYSTLYTITHGPC